MPTQVNSQIHQENKLNNKTSNDKVVVEDTCIVIGREQSMFSSNTICPPQKHTSSIAVNDFDYFLETLDCLKIQQSRPNFETTQSGLSLSSKVSPDRDNNANIEREPLRLSSEMQSIECPRYFGTYSTKLSEERNVASENIAAAFQYQTIEQPLTFAASAVSSIW